MSYPTPITISRQIDSSDHLNNMEMGRDNFQNIFKGFCGFFTDSYALLMPQNHKIINTHHAVFCDCDQRFFKNPFTSKPPHLNEKNHRKLNAHAIILNKIISSYFEKIQDSKEKSKDGSLTYSPCGTAKRFAKLAQETCG